MTESSRRIRKFRVLLGLMLIEAVYALHLLAIVSVMPAVSTALDGEELYGAAFSSFLLANVVGLVLAGRLVDKFGLVRPMLGGAALFMLGLVGAGAAPNMVFFVLARAVEGLGGGMIVSLLYAVITAGFEKHERPRVFTFFSAAWVIPSLGGAVLAAWVAESFGWRWVFWGVAPLLALGVGVMLGPLKVVETGMVRRRGTEYRTLDAVLLAAGVGAALWALDDPSWLRLLLVVPVATLVMLRTLWRILPKGTLTAKAGLPGAIALKGLVGFSFFGTDAYLPYALVELRGLSLVYGGLAISLGALSWTAGNWTQTWLRPAPAPRAMLTGTVLLTIGIAVLAGGLLYTDGLVMALCGWGLAGYAMGMSHVTANTSALAQIPPGGEGQTSSALGLMDSLSFGISAGVGGALVAAAERGVFSQRVALSGVWVMVLAVMVLSVFLSQRVQRG